VEMDRTLPSSWGSMFTKYKKRTWVAVSIEFGYLLGGDFFIATYGPQLLTAFGFSTSKSLLYQGAWLTILFINFIVAPFVDKFGRKPFLIIALSGEIVVLICMCALTRFYGDGHSGPGKNAFVACYLLFIAFTAISEPPAYLMSCEMFPLQVRSKGIALSFGTLALTNTWVIEAAAKMVQTLGYKAYLLFICFSFVNLIIWIVFIPETANVSLEEMAVIFGEDGDVAVRAHDIHLGDGTSYTSGQKL